MWKVSMRWKTWSDFKAQHSVQFSRRKLVEDRDTILELTVKIQELQNEVNCMNGSRDFKDAESVRSGLSHVTRQPTLQILAECQAVLWECRAATMGRQVFGTRMENRETFLKSNGVFFSTLSAGIESMEFQYTRTHITTCDEWEPNTSSGSERCQSGPSARNSFIPSEGRFSKNYGADQLRLQISDLHFDKFPNPATFASWKIRFKTEVCTCWQLLTEALQWIKEVEVVESADDLTDSFSIRGTQTPDFEVLDATIGRQIAYLIYEYFRVTEANDSVENYADLFTVVLRNDDIQEFDAEWDEIFLSMTQIASDDILESLYKLRIRESEKLNTVLELYNMQIHQKRAGPDYHRLEAMIQRSIEQNLRMKNFWSRKRKLWRKRRGQESRDKTARTKNPCRLLAMEVQRAVF